MRRSSSLTKRAAHVGLLGLMAALALTLASCGKNPTSYEDPLASITTTKTPTALIEAPTLKAWMDEGKVNNTLPNARDKVVIVTVGTPATYATSHIPGSVLLNSGTELTVGRLEAVSPLTSEVPDGASMDALVQKLGIDQYTTVVFTVSTGQNFLNATRAYFTFRYWGFARERLKILQGGDAGWTAAGYTLGTVATTAQPSRFSVRELYDGTGACLNFRMPIGDMIDAVDRINAGTLATTTATGVKILDVRGGVDPLVGPYVANAKVDDWNQYYVTGQSSTFKPLADMVTRLESFGITSSTSMTYVYCASGHRASSVFFVLDGILRWPVRLYDGSSGQWFGYRTANSVGTAWRVDTNSPNTTLPRTFGTIASGTLTLDPVANTILVSITDRRANQIFVEDKLYLSTGQASPSSPGDGGGDGTGSGC